MTNRANRKGSERIVVPNLLIAVGGIQPDMIRQLNKGGALTQDGMLQRCITILMGKPRVGEATGEWHAAIDYETLIRRLAAMGGPRTLELTEAAEAVRARVERRLFTSSRWKAWGPGSCRPSATSTARGAGSPSRSRTSWRRHPMRCERSARKRPSSPSG